MNKEVEKIVSPRPEVAGRIRLYKYISQKALNGLIENGTFKVTYREDCNDPQEMLEYGVDPQISRPYSERGFLSFSKNDNCAPLWGNYAEQYQGACVEFEFIYYNPEMIDASLPEEKPIFKYVNDLRKLDLDVKYINAFYNRGRYLPSVASRLLVECKYSAEHQRVVTPDVSETEEDALNKAEFFYWSVICTKDIDWSYEQEVRMLISESRDVMPMKTQSSNFKLTKVPTPYIKRIILGPMSELNPEDLAVKISAQRAKTAECEVYIPECVKIVKAKFSKYAYKLNYTNEEEKEPRNW